MAPKCENIVKCRFFNGQMGEKPATTQLYKDFYCHGKFKQCARYMVRCVLGPEKLPDDLFPNDKDRALSLLKEGVAELDI